MLSHIHKTALKSNNSTSSGILAWFPMLLDLREQGSEVRNVQMEGKTKAEYLWYKLKSIIVKTEMTSRLLGLRESNIRNINMNMNSLGRFLNSAY